jgi:deoxyribonuclease-4
VGVCIDTCHTYSAGYDIVAAYDDVFAEFDKVIGFEYLRGVHLNDSKKPLASRVDRHDSLGDGTLGTDFFKRFMNDSRFDNMPIILETPDEERWRDEIVMLRNFIL